MKNPLKDLLTGIFSKKEDAYVGIDIGTSSIKLVQIKKNTGRLILETYGEVALGPYEDRAEGELTNLPAEKLSEALKNLLLQANVTSSRALISISSATSLIFILKLPNINQKDIAGVVANEARKYIPIPLTEVSLDWWMIPEKEVYGETSEQEQQEEKKQIDVLVAAVRNEVVDKYNTIVSTLSMLSSTAYEIETFSAVRGSFKRELAPVMLVDSGASGTRVSVIEHGVVRKFHVVNRGSSYITSSIAKSLEVEFAEAEKLKREVGLVKDHPKQDVYNIIEAGTNYIFSEIQNVILDYEREYHKPIRKIILIGGGSLLKQYRESIERRYNITTEYADPFDKVVSPDFLREVLLNAGPEFAVSLGLALQELE
jgi:type IV pilus assembly protein PilM